MTTPAPTPTPARPLFRTAEECGAMAADLAQPERLQLFLRANRARRAQTGISLLPPSLPIDIQLP